MNNQENQFPQFNYGTPETEELHPQFAQQEVAVEPQPEFVQPMQQEVQTQFAQPEVAAESQPEFVQPMQQEVHPQFAQPVQEVAAEPQPQFVQPMQQEIQPQFAQPVQEPQPQFAQPLQQEVQPRFGQPMQPEFAQPVQQGQNAQFGQPAPTGLKDKKAKKEKQPKVKKEKIKKEKPENGKSKKKTLVIIIAGLLAAVMLIGAGVFYYFYAIAGSAPVSAARILDKIASAEKIEGRVTTGDIIGKSGEETQTIKITNTAYVFNRTVDKNRHMYVQGKLMVAKNNEDPQPLTKNNVFAFTLRPSMKAEWSILGQKGAYQTTGKEKESLEQFITKKNSDSQKNLGELRTFLLNGYRPTIKVEGKKTTISMNKDDLEKIARKIEENVKTDQEKFKSLLAKINPETDAKELIESCKNGELTKMVKEHVLPNIESLKLEFSFIETSDKTVVGNMTFQLKMSTQKETQTTTEYDIKTETTYTL